MEHSIWGAPSSLYTTVNCHGSTQATMFKKDNETIASITGVAAHSLVEHCLLYGSNPSSHLNDIFNGVTVDLEMVENVQIYINHIRALRIKYPGRSFIEKRVGMNDIPDIWGTSDHLHVSGNILFVDDLKYGYVIIHIDGLLQVIAYGLAAIDTLERNGVIKPGQITEVRTRVVQSRPFHADGDIREKSYTIKELNSYVPIFKQAIESSKKSNVKRKSGPWCHYCLAAGDCRTRIMDVVFNSTIEQPIETLNNQQIKLLLPLIPSFRKTLDAIEGQALKVALEGSRIDGFKVVRQVKRSVCNDESEFIKAANKKGIKTKDLFHPGKLKGKTVLRTVVGDLVDKHFTTPEAGKQLVEMHQRGVPITTDPLDLLDDLIEGDF